MVADGLSADHDVCGIDIRPVDRPGAVAADLTDMDSIQPLFEGVDAVIHLAAERRHTPDIGWDLLMPTNVVSTANVFDAAHAAGVRRFVFASSMHVMGMYEFDEPYSSIVNGRYDGLDPNDISLVTGDMATRPDGRYAATKILGESIGRYYAEAEGMEVISVRIGTIGQDDRPGSDPRSFVSWFSHRDVVGFFTACVEAPGISHEILYGASRNTWRVYDTPYAWQVLNFRPQDNAEEFRR
jgi:nucleoside-diphosphate-sugar epimerase